MADTSSPAPPRMTMDGVLIDPARPNPYRQAPSIKPMDIRCQCRSIGFRTPAPQPLAVYHCHCRECRRQSSTAYGTSAVYPVGDLFPLDPELRSKLSVYIRPGERSRTGRDMACFFCSECGARVMHRYLKRRAGQRSGVSQAGASRASRDDGTGCGGGGDLVGTDEADNTGNDTAGDTADAASSESLDLTDESVYDGTTITIKGGLITGLDYSKAIHIYTEQAVVPIPDGVTQYPGTPEE